MCDYHQEAGFRDVQWIITASCGRAENAETIGMQTRSQSYIDTSSAGLIRIGLIGDKSDSVRAHEAIPVVLGRAAQGLNYNVEVDWFPTSAMSEREHDLARVHGLWCVPGSPYKNFDGALAAIRFAREHGIPFLGTCGGFQHALIEYVRNVIGNSLADHEEAGPNVPMKLIAQLACPLVGTRGAIFFTASSRMAAAYGALRAEEFYHCNFGLNPQFESILDGGGLQITGRDAEGAARAVELPSHPFYLATLFQPELSDPSPAPHPLIRAFVEAASAHKPTGLPIPPP